MQKSDITITAINVATKETVQKTTDVRVTKLKIAQGLDKVSVGETQEIVVEHEGVKLEIQKKHALGVSISIHEAAEVME